MDRSPVEVVRSTYEALNRRDVDAMLESLAPAIEYRLPTDPLHVHPVFRGHAGVRELYERLLASLDGYRVTLGSVHDLGSGVVVATGHWHARLRGEPGEREVRFSHFWEIQDGRAVRVSFHDAQNPLELIGEEGEIAGLAA